MQTEKDTYVNLFAPEVNENASLFLKGSGYYHHSIDNDEDPNYTVLRNLKKDKGVNELSKQLDELRTLFVEND